MASINKKLLMRIFILAITTGILAFIFLNENGLLKFFKVKNEINNLNMELKNAEVKLQKLESEIDSLKTSRLKKEKVAREKYHMMKKNENVFKIEEN